MKQANTEINIDELTAELLKELGSMRKYRDVQIPEATLRDLVSSEINRYKNIQDIRQSVREKLHHIVAPYLGDPDYLQASAELSALQSSNVQGTRDFCLKMLGSHASTRERVPFLTAFYQQLWSVTGLPGSIIDLACGMHPFGLPWMGLEKETEYLAFDLHQPRTDLLNQFFRHGAYHNSQAVHQDILVQPPARKVQVALFFKEAHRFEQRQHGCNRTFWQALQVDWLLVSLPAENLTGSHSMRDRQQRLVETTLQGLDWPVTEIQIHQEIIYCIHKL